MRRSWFAVIRAALLNAPNAKIGYGEGRTFIGCRGCMRRTPRYNFPVYFSAMGHDHHDHHEPEQNEIGGPVVFALFLFAIVIVAIGIMAS